MCELLQRHSRVGGNLDARRAASVDVGPILQRPPHRPGAEERGAGGDEQAASKEEQEQQAARYACAASSGELVRGNGRRGGRGRRRGHWRASWGHRWRRCWRGRPGCHDVIRTRRGGPRCPRRRCAGRRSRCLRRPCLRGCLRRPCLRGCLRRRRASRPRPRRRRWWRRRRPRRRRRRRHGCLGRRCRGRRGRRW